MGKQGWLTIRNVPVNHKKSVGNPYHHVLVDFLKHHKICPVCKGVGWKFPKGEMEYEPETTVKYVGLEALEQLKALPEVRITDVVRDILEQQLWGKKVCRGCNGNKFVTNERFDELNHLRKLKRQRKQRGKTKTGKQGKKSGNRKGSSSNR